MNKEAITLKLSTDYASHEEAKQFTNLGIESKMYGKYECFTYTYPEFGPARFYKPTPEELVLRLGNQNYIIITQLDDSSGVPEKGKITFIPTDKQETPFHTDKEKQGYMTAFGQPNFIQSEVLCGANGKSACHLLTLETGWGDAGNVNILCFLDDNGIPAKAWVEASCC